MPATTYRRGTTVTRNGKTFPRRGGSVRYTPARGDNPLLDAARVASGWLGGKLWDGLENVTDRRGRKTRIEQDRRLHSLMTERAALMRDIAADDPEDSQRWEKIRRVHEIDREWRRAAGAVTPDERECTGCGKTISEDEEWACSHDGRSLCSSIVCRAEGCSECASDIRQDLD